MKILKVLRAGRYAKHHCYGPVLDLAEAQELKPDEYNDYLVEIMTAGADPAGEMVEVEDEEQSTIKDILNAIVEAAEDKNDAKDKLELWGQENLGIDVNKSERLEAVVDRLIKEYELQNG